MSLFLFKKKELVSIVAVIFLPAIFTLIWLFKNTQLPIADSANYLLTASNIYHHFVDQGFWNGLQHCYSERGWRPVFFPVISIPFLLVSQGNLLFTYNAVALLSLIFSSVYVYLLFRLRLSRLPAIIATNIIELLPLIQTQILGFYAESFLFPCVIGCVYHLIKSNYLQVKKHVFAFIILFSLAFMLRPVEAGMNLIVVLALLLFLGRKKHIFSLRQIIIVMAIGISGLFAFLLSIKYSNMMHHSPDLQMLGFFNSMFNKVALFTLLSWLLVLCMQRYPQATGSLNNPYHSSNRVVLLFVMPIVLIFLWFLPRAYQTFSWIYQTSIGGLAASTGLGTGKLISPQQPFLAQLNAQIHTEGSFIVLGIALLALVELSVFIVNGRQCLKNKDFLPVAYLLCLVPIPMLQVFLTVQDWPRKVSVAFPALLMALLMVAFQRKGKKSGYLVYCGFLLVIQFILMVSVTINKKTFNPFLDRLIGYYMPAPVTLNPNPHDVVEAFLTKQAKKYNLKTIALEVNPNTFEPIDPFLLATIVESKKLSYQVGYPYFEKYSVDNLLKLNKEYDAVFLSTNVSTMLVSANAAKAYHNSAAEEIAPSIKITKKMLAYYAENKLADIGWKLGPCIVIKSACLLEPVIKGIRQADCLGCLLLRNA